MRHWHTAPQPRPQRPQPPSLVSAGGLIPGKSLEGLLLPGLVTARSAPFARGSAVVGFQQPLDWIFNNKQAVCGISKDALTVTFTFLWLKSHGWTGSSPIAFPYC